MTEETKNPHTCTQVDPLTELEAHLLTSVQTGKLVSSLWSDARTAGLVHGNNYSDLFLTDTAESRELVRRHGMRIACTFPCNVCEKPLLEIAWAYVPYWHGRGM